VLFPGEGSQHVNMLSELCVHFPDMRRVFDLADRATVESGRAPAGTVVYPPPFLTPGAASKADAQLWSIDRATEAVLTAAAAVFALLDRLGVAPDMIAGHSAGEWIAMAAAGIVERDEFMTSLGNLAAIHRRLEDTWYKPLSDWCGSRGVALMGHPDRGDEIGVQRHFHMPGQDLVWRWVLPDHPTAVEGHESTQGKCSSSAMLHLGRRRNSNEFCGAYGHETTFGTIRCSPAR
jgi:hypothetical protein